MSVRELKHGVKRELAVLTAPVKGHLPIFLSRPAEGQGLLHDIIPDPMLSTNTQRGLGPQPNRLVAQRHEWFCRQVILSNLPCLRRWCFAPDPLVWLFRRRPAIHVPLHAIQMGTPVENVLAMLKGALGQEDYETAIESCRR